MEEVTFNFLKDKIRKIKSKYQKTKMRMSKITIKWQKPFIIYF